MLDMLGHVCVFHTTIGPSKVQHFAGGEEVHRDSHHHAGIDAFSAANGPGARAGNGGLKIVDEVQEVGFGHAVQTAELAIRESLHVAVNVDPARG
jgi:hypothetical protein